MKLKARIAQEGNVKDAGKQDLGIIGIGNVSS